MTRVMIVSVCVLILGLPGAPAVATSPPVAPLLDVFAWLEGEWVRESARGPVIEVWAKVSDSTMDGYAALTAEGRTERTEDLRIVLMGGEVFYIAMPAGNPVPVPFKLVEHSRTRFVFENKAHDFPHRLIYTRNGERGMVVRVEGPGESGAAGDIRGFDMQFEKR